MFEHYEKKFGGPLQAPLVIFMLVSLLTLGSVAVAAAVSEQSVRELLLYLYLCLSVC